MLVLEEKESSSTFLTVKNSIGLEICFCSHGASVYSIKLDGILMNAVHKSRSEYITTENYYGKTLGRVGGRIPLGIYKINNKTFNTDVNECKNTLHGGFKNFSFQEFTYDVKELNDGTHVYFSYYSKNGECGFNGDVEVVIEYVVANNENSLTIIYHAICSEDTILNLSNHLYFNLGEENNIYKHKLTLKTNLVSLLDEELLVKEYVPVNETFDFTNGMELGKHMLDNSLMAPKLRSYDHRFKFNNGNFNNLKAVLETDKYVMEAYSTYDNAIVYCNGYPMNNVMLLDGSIDKLHKSATLEFMSTEPILVKANENYLEKTKYKFFKKA